MILELLACSCQQWSNNQHTWYKLLICKCVQLLIHSPTIHYLTPDDLQKCLMFINCCLVVSLVLQVCCHWYVSFELVKNVKLKQMPLWLRKWWWLREGMSSSSLLQGRFSVGTTPSLSMCTQFIYTASYALFYRKIKISLSIPLNWQENREFSVTCFKKIIWYDLLRNFVGFILWTFSNQIMGIKNIVITNGIFDVRVVHLCEFNFIVDDNSSCISLWSFLQIFFEVKTTWKTLCSILIDLFLVQQSVENNNKNTFY